MSALLSLRRAAAVRRAPLPVRLRFAFVLLGALLAALALANIMSLSSWHGALTDHDDRAVVAAAMTDHDEGEPSLPAVNLHKMTHAVINGIADFAPDLGIHAPLPPDRIIWSIANHVDWRGIAAEGLLRPPRI